MRIDPERSRRAFLRFVASSPLLATAAFAGDTPSPRSDPMVWAHDDRVIASPKDALSVFDLETVAATKVPPAHFGYLVSGVDGEVTLRANRSAFQKYALRPRRLIDVSRIDMGVEILGERYASPIILAPAGGHKAYHPEGEIAVAKAAKAGDHLMILSTGSTTSVADVIAARGRPVWFQLYPTRSFEVAKHHVRSAERQGARVVAVTTDAYGSRIQETAILLRRTDTRPCAACHDRSSVASDKVRRPMYQGVSLAGLPDISSPGLDWDFIRRLRDQTQMKMVLKGILSAEDASLARANDIDAIIVSNHGGRTFDGAPATIDVLPEIVAAAGAMPVLIDSGFRRGADICKALCMGAKGVAVGRPYLWGLGAFGQEGVERALGLLRAELHVSMQEVGGATLNGLVPSMIRKN